MDVTNIAGMGAVEGGGGGGGASEKKKLDHLSYTHGLQTARPSGHRCLS